MTAPPQSPARLKMARLARMADSVSLLILRDDYPDIDCSLAVENLRQTTLEMFPGRDQLFDMVYLARFRRLYSQFRSPARPPF